MGVLKLTANNPRGVPHTVILPGSGCGPLKKRLQDSEGAPRERHVSGVWVPTGHAPPKAIY